MQLADHTQILDVERSLYKEIFKARTVLTDEDFESLHFIEQPLIKGTGFAKEKGIVHHIGIPTLPQAPPFSMSIINFMGNAALLTGFAGIGFMTYRGKRVSVSPIINATLPLRTDLVPA